jgi:hypothetical protein
MRLAQDDNRRDFFARIRQISFACYNRLFFGGYFFGSAIHNGQTQPQRGLDETI